MKCNEATIILPTHLFKDHPALNKKRPVYVVEHPRYFSDFTFCKIKLIFHRASCKAYYAYLKKEGYTAFYIEHAKADNLFMLLRKEKITNVHLVDLVDIPLEKQYKKEAKEHSIALNYYESPAFLTSPLWIKKYFKDKKGYNQEYFYRAQRKRLNILINTSGKPAGGKWNFDKENRKQLDEDVTIPTMQSPPVTEYVKEAKKYIEKHFDSNYGSSEFEYPVTHEDAKKWLNDFLKNRLSHFGDYEDAINSDRSVLFHSVLSPLLNVGLLTPQYVIDTTLSYAEKHSISLNNLEGFIRQIIGWREFIRAVYIMTDGNQRNKNFFNHKKKIPKLFWKGETGMSPVDTTIQKVLKTAYAHHIERLMILGNIMLLCQIKPDDVYTWFMELFIDAYDWVMVPNVYGMSQYADGGIMTTKPYFSGSNYILKMSNYKKNEWSLIWDSLFWYFVGNNKKVLKENARLYMIASMYDRMNKEKKKKYEDVAEKFLKKV